MTPRPWAVGTHEERWQGYLIAPGSEVLRNRLGATTLDGLRDAENDLVEARLLELRSAPTLVARTYDLAHLCALHRHLFQDLYDWAGEPRTVGIVKGEGESFAPPLSIGIPAGHVAQRIDERDRLRHVTPGDLPGEVAYLYDYLNFAHPFRDGNGRTQREFFAQLLAESGHGLDWESVVMTELHDACHRARNDGDLAPLYGIFGRIITEEPGYPRSR